MTEVGTNEKVIVRGHAEDKREAVWKIMELTFVAEPATYVFYNNYARDNGFAFGGIRFGRAKVLRKNGG